DSRVACVLTGHQLKDPHATVAYHSYDEARLRADYGEFGVATARFANHPIQVANSLGDIVDAVRRAIGG
ncbi:MAG: threonine synthase, partial [Planctomycetes bacterium]|nr:threonine synthase [Planctomycetota bacterium]